MANLVEYPMCWTPHMETIHVVLDSKLLRAAEVAARRTKLNRSALIREALRAHLKNLEIRYLSMATVAPITSRIRGFPRK